MPAFNLRAQQVVLLCFHFSFLAGSPYGALDLSLYVPNATSLEIRDSNYYNSGKLPDRSQARCCCITHGHSKVLDRPRGVAEREGTGGPKILQAVLGDVYDQWKNRRRALSLPESHEAVPDDSLWGETTEFVDSSDVRPLSKRLLLSGFLKVFERDNWRLVKMYPFDPAARAEGRDWPPPPLAHTMIGLKRLDNLQACIESVLRDDIPGDLD